MSRDAIEAYVNAICALEMQERGWEGFAALSARGIFRAELWAHAEDLADRFSTPGGIRAEFERGRLHPSNTPARRLFRAVTGTPLPRTAEGTKAVIEALLGEPFYTYVDESGRRLSVAPETTRSPAFKRATLV